MLSTLKLASSTLIGREQQKKLNLIISYLIDTPQSAQFLHPVEWQELELNDYPSIVKYPMNLLRVQDKLRNKQYQTVEQLLDHIQLIWDNCKAYNNEGPFVMLAEKMQRQFKKMIKNYLPNIQIIIPISNYTLTVESNIVTPPPINHKTHHNHQKINRKNNSTTLLHHTPEETHQIIEHHEIQEIPLSQKNRFHQRLKQLTQQELAQIVINIQQYCPQAFKQYGCGRCQILIDLIDLETFKKINEKVDDILDHDKINHANKKIKI